jgi:hypothetical protein
MTQDVARPAEDGGDLEAGVRYYLFIGCAGLLTLWLGMSQEFGILALVPVLMGALGLARYLAPASWRGVESINKTLPSYAMLPLMLISLVILELFLGYSPWGTTSFLLASDLLIGIGFVSYMLGLYRVDALRAQAVPTDSRPAPNRAQRNEAPPVRPGHFFAPRELLWPALVIPLSIVAGQLCWQWIAAGSEWSLYDSPPVQLGTRDTVWRLLSLTWLLGVGALILTAAGGIMRLYRMSGAEAQMLSQDILWIETRGEQRQINRWLAWLRRKRGRKSGEIP